MAKGIRRAVVPGPQWRSIEVKARGAQIPLRVVALSTRRRHAQIRSWLAAFAAAVLIAAVAGGTATAATTTTVPAGDPTVITDWNAIATTTLLGDTTKVAPEVILYMGFVQAAVYDAVVGVE